MGPRDIMTAKSDEELKEYLKTVGLAKAPSRSSRTSTASA